MEIAVLQGWKILNIGVHFVSVVVIVALHGRRGKGCFARHFGCSTRHMVTGNGFSSKVMF